MKVAQILLIVGCAIGAYLVYVYFLKRKIFHYITPNGHYVLKWDVPTGTPPFTYQYTITDETGTQIISSSTSDTTLTLDPSLFVALAPPPSGAMSDKTFTAVLTPINAEGSGDDDTFSFKLYDTPTINVLKNAAGGPHIYPPSHGGEIFGIGESYNTLVSPMLLSLDDRVTTSNLSVSIAYKNKSYYPILLKPENPNSSGEASEWTVVWANCSSGDAPLDGGCTPQVTFSTGDQVAFNFSATNPGGTAVWTQTYTVPAAPAVSPGDIQGSVAFVAS